MHYKKKWIIEYFLYIYDGGCRLCYLEMVTVEHWVGNVFGECNAACTLKSYFVDFEKELEHCSDYRRLNA